MKALMTLAAAGALGTALVAGPAAGAPWDDMLAAGKKEGKVVVAGPAFPHLRDYIVKAFKEDTGIEVEWKPLVGGPGPFIAALLREAEANAVTTDVYIGGTTSCFAFTRVKNAVVNMKDLLVHPEVTDGKKWVGGKLRIQTGTADKLDDDNFWCFMQTADWVMTDLFVNSKLVDPTSIKLWKDLLDPKFKGKIIADDPKRPGAGRATAAYLYEVFGEDFVKKLYIDQGATLSSAGPAAIGEDLAKGKYTVALALVQAAAERYRKEGFPLERVFPADGMGLVTGGFSGLSALNGPNKNARNVFLNWFAGKKAQESIQCLLMEQSLRTDLASYACIPDYTKPKQGVAYPVHDYDKKFHFGSKQKLADNVPKIFGQ
ncbi:MAG: extracellular solute-binding protein [Alphaproteobacteria bacterium]|nr:extracellular solute-binding protein [Alphaproteobacteria bacterium]